MSVQATLTLLKTIGFLTAGGAIGLIAYTIYLSVQAHPKLLKQRIIETTPKPPPKPIPMKRIVEVTVEKDIEKKLNDFFGSDKLAPEWHRT